MKISITTSRHAFSETDCRHWMELHPKQSPMNDLIDATRQQGGEPDCAYWLQFTDAHEELVVSTSDNVEKRVPETICTIREGRP